MGSVLVLLYLWWYAALEMVFDEMYKFKTLSAVFYKSVHRISSVICPLVYNCRDIDGSIARCFLGIVLLDQEFQYKNTDSKFSIVMDLQGTKIIFFISNFKN